MTPLTVVHQASMSFTISWSLLRFMSIESVMLSNHLIFCPLLLLPSIFPSSRFVCLFVCLFFSSELALHIRRPKDWSSNFSISPSNEYLGLISFRIDWFDFFEVQGTQESSPAPQFESISLSGLSLLCGPTHIRSWKNHSFGLRRHLLVQWTLCFSICCLSLS